MIIALKEGISIDNEGRHSLIMNLDANSPFQCNRYKICPRLGLNSFCQV